MTVELLNVFVRGLACFEFGLLFCIACLCSAPLASHPPRTASPRQRPSSPPSASLGSDSIVYCADYKQIASTEVYSSSIRSRVARGSVYLQLVWPG